MAERPSINPIPLVDDGRYATLRICGSDLVALKRHVFNRYPRWEWGTFVRLGYHRAPWGVAMSYVDPLLPLKGDLDRQSGATVFREPYSSRAFKAATEESGLAIGVVHSHPEGCRVSPSDLDDDMDGYFGREFTAFGRSAPYCSFILQESSELGFTFSGRVLDRGEWLPLRFLLSSGDTVERFTSELCQNEHMACDEELDGESTTQRLEGLFGERAARRLKASVVGVVGCSGTGSPAIEVLARAGVGEFVLLDPQRLSSSNLERMHGSKREDLDRNPHEYKVDLMRRLIREINPAAKVTSLVGNILHEQAMDELLRCDIVLGCTDSFHGRAALSDLARHYLVPSIDVGVLMDGADGKVTTQLIEFTAYEPEFACGFCSGQIDSRAMSEELMSEEEAARHRQAAQDAIARGAEPDQYWKGKPRQLNTVGYLTTAAGSLAAGYAEGRLTGAFAMPHSRFQFDIGQHRLGAADFVEKRDLNCSCGAHVGWADQARDFRSLKLPAHWPKRAILTGRA